MNITHTSDSYCGARVDLRGLSHKQVRAMFSGQAPEGSLSLMTEDGPHNPLALGKFVRDYIVEWLAGHNPGQWEWRYPR